MTHLYSKFQECLWVAKKRCGYIPRIYNYYDIGMAPAARRSFHSFFGTYQRLATNRFFDTHEILNISESTILNFKSLPDSFILTITLIYKYRLKWICVQPWHHTPITWKVFDTYSFRFINLEKYGIRQIPFFLENALKQLLNIFSNSFFYLKVQSFR